MKILVVSPHPDDETLGAGGTLLKFKNEGDKLFWLNFTGMKAAYGYSRKQIKKRSLEIAKARQSYGFNGFWSLELRPAGLDTYASSELIRKAAEVVRKVEPDVIILPFKNDIHSDHRIVFDTLFSCTKIFRFPHVKRILMMEIISETDFASPECGFVPNYFVDISKYIDGKIRMLELYEEEIAEPPFSRSRQNVRSLAEFRGSAAGCRCAEAFMLVKEIS